MHLMKFICLTLIQLLKQTCLVPHNAVLAVHEWRLQAARNRVETERLDRIRNPDKYQGR